MPKKAKKKRKKSEKNDPYSVVMEKFRIDSEKGMDDILATSIKFCLNCTHYTPCKEYPGYHAGKCANGFKQFGGMDERFDVREDNSCKNWEKKGK